MSRCLPLVMLMLLALPLLCRADVEFALGQLSAPANSVRGGEGDDAYLQAPVKDARGRLASAEANGVEAGRYSVTYKLAAPPFGASKAQVDCILDITGQPQQRKTLLGPDFPQDETPLTVTLDAVLAKPAAVRVYVEWSENTAKELPWLRIYGITVVRQDKGLGLTGLRPGKLLYHPGEQGKLNVTVRNFTNADVDCELQATLTSDLAKSTTLPALPLTVAAGEEKQVEIPFTAGPTQYGYEAGATLTQVNRGNGAAARVVLDTRSDVFNISDDVWKVALGASGISIMGMSGYCSEGSLQNDIKLCRDTYSNWWEKMFWPPDDWGDMTPERNEWISGQSARWENAANIKAFIALAKANGIASVTYGKHGTGGPEGWELTRKHPEWFYTDDQGHISGSFNTWDLAFWHDIKRHVDPQGRKQYASDWWGSMPDFRQQAPLEWGLNELLESSKIFGWDGVRFDGHWTAGNDDLSTANMQRLKQAMWAYNPNYVFGFNQSWSFGHQTSSTAAGMVAGYNHELRESLAGGGMYMQEAIGQWTYAMGSNMRYASWKDYATKEAANATGVRALGGTYHFIYGSWNLPPTTGMYKFVLGTAGGIHPVYGDHMRMPGCPNWGRFLTRWSGLVWDMNLQPLPAEGNVEVTAAAPVWWREWVKERVVDAKTRQVIVHLINPPVTDDVNAKDMLLPAPLTNVTVRVKVPAGQKASKVALVDPSAATPMQPLPGKMNKGWVEAVVPRVNVWNMVVVEFDGKFPVPVPPARIIEAPDPAKVEEGRKGTGKALGIDPLRPDDHGQVKKNVWNFETDSGYNSCPGRGIADPDALNGVAQVREKGEKTAYVGRTWLGPLPAGKYVAHMRIKLEGAGKQYLGMRLLIHNTDDKLPAIMDKNIDFATEEYKRNDAAHTLAQDGKYHDYDIAFECPKDGLYPCFIAGTGTEAPDATRLLMDRILIEQTERYTDTQQAEKNPMQPPAELKVGGAPGLDVLVVKGWTWDTYKLGEVMPTLTAADRVTEIWSDTGEAINFPQKYEDVFKYDVVILCNVGAYGLQYPGRKILKDFVEAGGGLVVLGGLYTLGQGNMAGTYFDDLLPVTLTDGRDVQRAAGPLALKPGKGPLDFTDLGFAQQPAVYWRHLVTVKADATTSLLAGKEPFLVTGSVGKGRVAVVTGTALGDKVAAETPFWAWLRWPTVLERTVKWAAGQ